MDGYLRKALGAGTLLVTAFCATGALGGEQGLFAVPAISAEELAIERAQGPDPLAVVENVTVEDNTVNANGAITSNGISGNAFQNARGVITNIQNNGHSNAISVPVGVSVSITP